MLAKSIHFMLQWAIVVGLCLQNGILVIPVAATVASSVSLQTIPNLLLSPLHDECISVESSSVTVHTEPLVSLHGHHHNEEEGQQETAKTTNVRQAIASIPEGDLGRLKVVIFMRALQASPTLGTDISSRQARWSNAQFVARMPVSLSDQPMALHISVPRGIAVKIHAMLTLNETNSKDMPQDLDQYLAHSSFKVIPNGSWGQAAMTGCIAVSKIYNNPEGWELHDTVMIPRSDVLVSFPPSLEVGQCAPASDLTIVAHSVCENAADITLVTVEDTVVGSIRCKKNLPDNEILILEENSLVGTYSISVMQLDTADMTRLPFAGQTQLSTDELRGSILFEMSYDFCVSKDASYLETFSPSSSKMYQNFLSHQTPWRGWGSGTDLPLLDSAKSGDEQDAKNADRTPAAIRDRICVLCVHRCLPLATNGSFESFILPMLVQAGALDESSTPGIRMAEVVVIEDIWAQYKLPHECRHTLLFMSQTIASRLSLVSPALNILRLRRMGVDKIGVWHHVDSWLYGPTWWYPLADYVLRSPFHPNVPPYANMVAVPLGFFAPSIKDLGAAPHSTRCPLNSSLCDRMGPLAFESRVECECFLLNSMDLPIPLPLIGQSKANAEIKWLGEGDTEEQGMNTRAQFRLSFAGNIGGKSNRIKMAERIKASSASIGNGIRQGKAVDANNMTNKIFFLETEDFGKGLSRLEYRKLILDSEVVLSPIGLLHPDSFRLWEALAMGAIPVVQDRSFWNAWLSSWFMCACPTRSLAAHSQESVSMDVVFLNDEAGNKQDIHVFDVCKQSEIHAPFMVADGDDWAIIDQLLTSKFVDDCSNAKGESRGEARNRSVQRMLYTMLWRTMQQCVLNTVSQRSRLFSA